MNKVARFNYRINTPGKLSRKNWSIILPISLEKLIESNIGRQIKGLLEITNRA
jgi:hypothetical protein